MQVFLSYAHSPLDEKLAFYIAARLRGVGVSVWMDKSSLHAAPATRHAMQAAAAASARGSSACALRWLTGVGCGWARGLFHSRLPGLPAHFPLPTRPRR